MVKRLEVECRFTRGSCPPILSVLYPVGLLDDLEWGEEPREALSPIHAAPRCHDHISAARCGHQQAAIRLQNFRQTTHNLNVAVVLVDLDSISSSDAHVLNGGTVDGHIKVIPGKFQFQEIALHEFDVGMPPMK